MDLCLTAVPWIGITAEGIVSANAHCAVGDVCYTFGVIFKKPTKG